MVRGISKLLWVMHYERIIKQNIVPTSTHNFGLWNCRLCYFPRAIPVKRCVTS
jgi:hypothetical protein